MTQTPKQQEVEAFLKGKPVEAAFHTELSTRVEALLKGLEASTKSLGRSGADLHSPTAELTNDKELNPS